MSSSSLTSSYYDSHGDYQADDASGKFLKESSSFSLYQEQDSLPHLPVNSIADTIEKLKPSCLALLSNNHPNEDQNAKERKDFLNACDSFPDETRGLQLLLETRAKSEDNWLQSWWNQIGYLGVRDPSPINVNYTFNFPKTQHVCGVTNPLERGAKLLHSVYDFSESVRSGNLSQDRFGKQQTPLCSGMYKYMFYSCRIPRQARDVYRIYHCDYYTDDGSRAMMPKHVVVSAKGHYFSVDLTDPSDGRPYSVPELELALQECVTQASTLTGDRGSSVAAAAANAVRNLGILTTANRDEWASNRGVLIDRIHGMKEALHQLESGLMLLCLDADDPITIDSLGQNSRSYLMGTQGRWYDKSIQFIMTATGNVGLNGEHSMMDGMPMVRLQDYILKKETEDRNQTESPTIKTVPAVTPIFASPAILDKLGDTERESLQSMKDKAASDFDKIRNSLDLEVQSFRGYGANWIKKYGKCSPDAYVQMAIQLAVGKLSTTTNMGSSRGHDRDSTRYVPMATYESTQVRPFKYGRTETTRSVSAQSVEWVDAMLNRKHNNSNSNSKDDDQSALKSLFHKATDAHVNYIRGASKGLGVDRHLFGLQMILAEQQSKSAGATAPEIALFNDPLFIRSKQWLVSTSTLPSNPGFGPVTIPQGVGIAYDVKANHVYFTCTSYLGSTPALSHYLEESLLEMRELMIADEGHEKRSKL